MSSNPSPTIRHRPELSRFQSDDGAFLEYQKSGGAIAFEHTFVPDALRGRGMASLLAEAGLDFARQSGLRAAINCAYVRAYVARHPEYQNLVIEG